MLGKLLKYEFTATRKLILPLFLVVIAMAALNRLVISIDAFDGVLQIIPGSIMVLYILSLIAVLLLTSFYLVVRFYKNYMTDEGYLMFTLPVNSHQLTISKLVSAMIWTVATILVILISVLIVVYTPERMTLFMEGLDTIIAELQVTFGTPQTTILIIEIGLYIFIASIYSTLMIYFAIALGQLFSNHKIVGAFAAYMGLYTITQVLSTLVLMLLGALSVPNLNDITLFYKLIMPASIIISLIMSGIYYLGIQYIFKNKMNLE